MKIQEETLKIHGSGKKTIYCTLGLPAKQTKKVVVFVHGLGCSEHWPPLLLGSWFFRNKGYAYCRINLYDWRPNARSLMTSDLNQHSRDTDTVIREMRKLGFSQIFCIGHSFGGLTLLRIKHADVDAMSLWDISSFISYPPSSWYKTDRKTNALYLRGSSELFLSARYKKGIEKFPDELSLIKEIAVPVQICYAAGPEAMLVESSQRYFKNLQSKKQLVAIPKASHSFTEEGITEKLFDKTRRFFSSI